MVKEVLKAAGLIVLALILTAGIVLGGWAAGWWLREENTQRNDRMYDTSYGRQQALKTQITSNITLVFTITTQIEQAGADVELGQSLQAQRLHVVGLVCADAVKINPSNPLTGDQAVFVAANCAAGAVSPSSVYTKR